MIIIFSAHPKINILFPVMTRKWADRRAGVTPVDGPLRLGEMAALGSMGGE